MRPIIISAANTDTDGVATRVDYRENSFKVGVGLEITSGTPTYSLQHTFDDPADHLDFAAWATNAKWYDNADVALVGATTDQNGNFNFPIQGVKVIVTAGTGAVQATILQAGSH